MCAGANFAEDDIAGIFATRQELGVDYEVAVGTQRFARTRREIANTLSLRASNLDGS